MKQDRIDGLIQAIKIQERGDNNPRGISIDEVKLRSIIEEYMPKTDCIKHDELYDSYKERRENTKQPKIEKLKYGASFETVESKINEIIDHLNSTKM